MRSDVADQLEAFVEAGAPWDDHAVADIVAQHSIGDGSPELPPLRSGPSRSGG